MRRNNKGIVLTMSAVVEGLFFIGVISLLLWLFLSRILEIHNSVTEANAERHAINLANVLISSEKLAHENDVKISRGILDSSKLDSIFTKNSVNYELKDIGIGYPNSLNLVKVIDLESCQDATCDMWMAVLSAPTTIEGLSAVKFTNCMADTASTDIGSIFRAIPGYIIGGPVGSAVASLWQPWDIEECIKNTLPENVKSFFTGSLISSEGLPVLIRYPNGDLHVGRIVVGVGEWI